MVDLKFFIGMMKSWIKHKIYEKTEIKFKHFSKPTISACSFIYIVPGYDIIHTMESGNSLLPSPNPSFTVKVSFVPFAMLHDHLPKKPCLVANTIFVRKSFFLAYAYFYPITFLPFGNFSICNVLFF